MQSAQDGAQRGGDETPKAPTSRDWHVPRARKQRPAIGTREPSKHERCQHQDSIETIQHHQALDIVRGLAQRACT